MQHIEVEQEICVRGSLTEGTKLTAVTTTQPQCASQMTNVSSTESKNLGFSSDTKTL